MTDLYNFCSNYDKIQKVTSKDITHLERSTQAIINAAQENINANNSSSTDTSNNNGNTNTSATGNNNNNASGNGSTTESAYSLNGNYFTEADDANSNNNATNQNNNKPGDTGLTLDVSKASGSIKNDQGSKSDKDAYAKSQAKGVNTEDENTDLIKCIDTYMSICRTIITAKWTAAEQIAKDYMAIIRAHVRSYVGNDKDVNDNTKTKQGSKYKPDNNGNTNDQGQSADQIADQAKQKASADK